MESNKDCKIPLIDWGRSGCDLEAYISIATQPGLMQGDFEEVIAWRDIDKKLAETCKCGVKREIKSWDSIKRSLNKLDKKGAEVFNVVEIAVGKRNEKIVILRFLPKRQSEAGHGYTSIPCKYINKIMNNCNSPIDLAVYVMMRGEYYRRNYQMKKDNEYKPLRMTPKVMATEYLSYHERNIVEAITRLKRAGLLQFCIRYVQPKPGAPVSKYRDIIVRDLDEWDKLLRADYDFAKELDKIEGTEFASLSDISEPNLLKNKKCSRELTSTMKTILK